MIRLFNDSPGLVLVQAGTSRRAPNLTIDAVFTADDPHALVRSAWESAERTTLPLQTDAPIGTQEVWAAGVTYLRSRTARMEESKDTGGGTFYDKVYHADRPELFFKGTPHRVAASGTHVRIRGDSQWNDPEPRVPSPRRNSHSRRAPRGVRAPRP